MRLTLGVSCIDKEWKLWDDWLHLQTYSNLVITFNSRFTTCTCVCESDLHSIRYKKRHAKNDIAGQPLLIMKGSQSEWSLPLPWGKGSLPLRGHILLAISLWPHILYWWLFFTAWAEIMSGWPMMSLLHHCHWTVVQLCAGMTCSMTCQWMGVCRL